MTPAWPPPTEAPHKERLMFRLMRQGATALLVVLLILALSVFLLPPRLLWHGDTADSGPAVLTVKLPPARTASLPVNPQPPSAVTAASGPPVGGLATEITSRVPTPSDGDAATMGNLNATRGP